MFRLLPVYVLLVGVVMGGCSPLAVVNTLVVGAEHRALTDVAYGPHVRHRLDVYNPGHPTGSRAGEAAPVVVFFYGGSWKRGDRENYRFVGEALAEQGFMVVVPDYRTWPDVHFPAFVDDAALVLSWVRENAAEYGGDVSTLVVAGHSAGAHIAALVALDGRYLEQVGMRPGDIAGVVGLAGPYAFHPLEARSVRAVFEHLDDVDEARPITRVSAEAPPMLLLHGDADGTVLPENSQRMAAALTDVGVAVDLRLYPGVGHVGIMAAALGPLRGRAPVVADITEFVRSL